VDAPEQHERRRRGRERARRLGRRRHGHLRRQRNLGLRSVKSNSASSVYVCFFATTNDQVGLKRSILHKWARNKMGCRCALT
jgi:hypothetical protein